MAFIKLSNVCDDPEDELFHDTAEQRAARAAWALATKELSGLPAIFGTHWTHKWLHPEIVGFLRTLSTEEAEAWDYDVRNALASEEAGVDDYDAFADVENWEDFVYDDFEAQEAAKICIAAAAYVVNSQPTSSPRESAAITPRRQTGGSDSDDSASDDHDSHVQAYLHCVKYPRLICWTSALEVVTAAIPAAKTIQKHTYQIGNLRLDLADYPADLIPDYTFHTLIRAARDTGYLSDPVTLDLALKSTNPSPFYKQFSPAPALLEFTCEDDEYDAAENLADRPIGNVAILDGWEQKDFATRMREIDPDNKTYKSCKITAEKCFRSWMDDQMHDEMVLAAWHDGYSSALQCFNPAHADPARSYQLSFATYAHTSVRNKAGRDVLKNNKIYVTGADIRAEIEAVESKLRRPLLTDGQRESLSRELEFLKVARGRNFLVKRSVSLDAPLAPFDSDDGLITTGLDLLESEDTGGEKKIAQSKLVDHLISQLSRQAQDVVRAKYLEEMTHKEIADRLCIPFCKVSTILSAATASLAAAANGAGIDKEDVL